MNKILLLSLLLSLMIGLSASAQNDERFTFGLHTELADKNTHTPEFDYGFNLGAHIELQGEWFYIRAKTYWFPELNDIPYFDFDGGGGLNWRSFTDKDRVYLGGFIGVINREGWGHGKLGAELGYDHYFDSGFFIGIKGDYQYKHDDKIWRYNDSGHEVWSSGIVIGWHW